MKELYTLRDKLISNLKDLESKNGPGASQSQMILESIEQNKINSDVIKSQFINSITLILKHALIEYATTLQNISGLSNINTEVFFKLLRDRERGNQNIHQSNRIQPRGLTVFNQKNSSYSGGISSIHSNEAQDFARLQKQQTRSGGGSPTKSSPYAQQQEQQQMQQQNLQQDQSSIVMLCEECLKMDIRTRPPCQHYQGSRETSKDVYTPSENWN